MPYGITVATDEKAIGKALYEPLAPFPTQVPPWIYSYSQPVCIVCPTRTVNTQDEIR